MRSSDGPNRAPDGGRPLSDSQPRDVALAGAEVMRELVAHDARDLAAQDVGNRAGTSYPSTSASSASGPAALPRRPRFRQRGR